MSAVACIPRAMPAGREIREFMSGNLCRCGAYNSIVAAVRKAAPSMEGRGMIDFDYPRATSLDGARRASSAAGGRCYLAGGTTLIDLAKCGVAQA